MTESVVPPVSETPVPEMPAAAAPVAKTPVAPKILDTRVDLKSMTRAELSTWMMEEMGQKKFRGTQIFEWLHRNRARTFDDMTNVSKVLRERLATKARIGGLTLDDVKVAKDGTRKLILSTDYGQRIETVLIPMEDSITQCVSSQVGCKMGCDFCLTARMPQRRDLSASEIADQILWARQILEDASEDPERPMRVTNIVYMGMGEPLDNYDEVVRSLRILMDDHGQNYGSRRITVSTSGVVPRIPQLGHDVPVNLAVSLNASHDEQRSELLPINRRWNIAALIQSLHEFPLPLRRRITIEYVMLGGVNDARDDAHRLVPLLRGLSCKVNLIPFNPWPGSQYIRPSGNSIARFGDILRDAGYIVTVRYSKGDDIGAACGQLDGQMVAA